MKKRFIAKKPKKHRKGKLLFFVFLFLFSLCISIRSLASISLQGTHKELASILLAHGNCFLENKNDASFLKKTISYLLQIDIKEPSTLLYTGYRGVWKEKTVKEQQVISKTVETSGHLTEQAPKVYIYNTHQKEEYRPSSFLEYSVSPNVMLASYILKEQLDKAGLFSLVEERSVQDEVSRLGKKYYYSYQVSRRFLEEAKAKNPTLTYFIDVHRDSVSRAISYHEKDGKGYAKILFIVGLENPNYAENLAFTKQIFDKMEEKVPGITRSIYQKEGAGVDGVYNQDVSANAILAEIGGSENTVDEVYNTTLVLAEALKEVILK